MFIRTFIGLAAALSAAVAFPRTTAGTKQVRMHVFGEDNCNGPITFMSANADTCYEFVAGIKSLRVVHHDNSIRYNARKSLPWFSFLLALSLRFGRYTKENSKG